MSEKFDAREYGWTLEMAEKNMAIVPSCENCRSVTFIHDSVRRGNCIRCNKRNEFNTNLCKDWMPQTGIVRHTAIARMAYLQLKKKQ